MTTPNADAATPNAPPAAFPTPETIPDACFCSVSLTSLWLFENYVLQPTIIGKAADISGFLVILSVLFWGALFGVVGAVVGVPITAAILIIVEELTADRRARIAAGRPAEPDLAT